MNGPGPPDRAQSLDLSTLHGRDRAQTPASNQSPCGGGGRRLLGPAALRACPFASLLSQARALLSAF